MYSDELIVREVDRKIRKETKENMDVYRMSLGDAFEKACRKYAEKGTELYKAWYYNDFREYIPSAYIGKYLDFESYPLPYK